MGKSTTIGERADMYMRSVMDLRAGDRDQGQNQILRHLAAFAASEVARVREMQTRPVKILRALLNNGGHWYTSSDAIKAIDAATRPERPARAKAKRLVVKPDPPVVIPPRTKRIRGLSFKATDFLDPPAALSSLARTVKKRGAK